MRNVKQSVWITRVVNPVQNFRIIQPTLITNKSTSAFWSGENRIHWGFVQYLTFENITCGKYTKPMNGTMLPNKIGHTTTLNR